jgi:hypothetical protein
MSNEAWVIAREMETLKKIFVAIWIIVFDFELVIGGRAK